MKSKQIQLKWIFTASLINNTGAALLWPLTTVYMHNYLGESMTVAGIVMFVMSACMMLGNYIGGWLFDHWTPYMAATVPVVVAAVSAIGLALFDRWPAFSVWMCLISFGDGASLTVINSYGTAVPRHSGRYIFNLIYMAQNIGVVIGTLLVGVLLPISPQWVFVTTAICYVLFLLVTLMTFNVELPHERYQKHRQRTGSGANRGVKVVYALCLCLVTVYLSYILWETIMSVRMTDMHIPFFYYSLLWTVNGVLIMVGQPFMNNLAAYMSIRKQILIGISIFAASFLLLIFAHTFVMFLIDFIILTVGEMMGIAAVPAYIGEITDPAETGKYQGMPTVAMSLGRAIGPLYAGLIIDHFNYEFLFLSVFAMMAITLAITAAMSRGKEYQK